MSRLVSHSADGYYQALILLAMYQYGAAVPTTFYQVVGLAILAERTSYYVLKLGLKRERPVSRYIRATCYILRPSRHLNGRFLPPESAIKAPGRFIGRNQHAVPEKP